MNLCRNGLHDKDVVGIRKANGGCAQCSRDAEKRWRLANIEKCAVKHKLYRSKNLDRCRAVGKQYRELPKNREYRRNRDLLNRYGITLAERNAMEERQGGRCAICNNQRPLLVDHCHTTGRVRGLLCYKCNSAIGYFSEDVQALQRAVAYLEPVPAQ